jgi:YcxB-like protein
MWERRVPVGELYALSAFKQVRGRWIVQCRGFGAFMVVFGVLLCFVASGFAGGVLIAMGAFMLVWPDILLRRASAASIRRAGGELVTLTITEDELKVTSPNWSNGVNWRLVRRIVERDERWLVYVTKRTVIPVPKSAFTDTELDSVRDFLTSRSVDRPPHDQLTAER